jgi:excinuclease UvrABC nuclease subunit
MEQTTHLYRHFNKNGDLLYVGISNNALSRLSQHKNNASWFDNISRIEMESHPNREAALKAEKVAIRTEKPFFNISSTKGTDRVQKIFRFSTELVESLRDAVHEQNKTEGRRVTELELVEEAIKAYLGI